MTKYVENSKPVLKWYSTGTLKLNEYEVIYFIRHKKVNINEYKYI